jgi:ribosomal peptide maturation radical SAM protein 1
VPATERVSGVDVLFVVMPFADARRPAIGVSLLKAALLQRGRSARIRYFSLDVAQDLGGDVYKRMASELPSETLPGEWIFAKAAFPDHDFPPAHEYLARVLRPVRGGPEVETAAVSLRDRADRFVDRWVRDVVAIRPRVVGFTCTFQQTVPSLALARRLKELPDPPTVVFGGASCEGEMGLELLRSFPWIDAVCTQEGDNAFPDALPRLLDGEDHLATPGLTWRGDERVDAPAPILDLDQLPVPDYHDYFDDLARTDLARDQIVLPMETARGCWWGAKHHCTFCGLNGGSMSFRSKSADRAHRELSELVARYGIDQVGVVDNILDHAYFGTLLPRLRDEGPKVRIAWEVKANLRYDQLLALRDAGVDAIQPGIESLNDDVLLLMRKGCTALQNLRLLRWAAELGLLTEWNLLTGFPKEPPEAYARMAELIPLVVHLMPPNACDRIRLDRFSPNFDDADGMGLAHVRPFEAYRHAFPLPDGALARLAYYFSFDYADGRRPETYTAGVAAEVDRWIALHDGSDVPPRLDLFEDDEGLVVIDTRPVALRGVHLLQGLEAHVYRICDEPRSVETVAERLAEPAASVRAAIDRLIEARLLVEEGGRCLSLAVFRVRRDRPPAMMPLVEPRVVAGR